MTEPHDPNRPSRTYEIKYFTPTRGAFNTPRRPVVKPDLTPIETAVAKWANSVTFDQIVPARDAELAATPEGLHPLVIGALAQNSLTKLYVHQAVAIAHILAGKSVALATPTASGKSLCYIVPIADSIARNSASRALLVFPTKALARDQMAAICAWLELAGIEATVAVLDGDTPPADRIAAREAQILITTPEMLQVSILPNHTRWPTFFNGLKHVVFDEAHTYNGLFGAHVANVNRRLQRVCELHGAAPSFVLSSATIGNAREHAENLIGRQVELVDQSGAPMGARRVVVVQPSLLDTDREVFETHTAVAARVAADLALSGVPFIVFADSRYTVEAVRREIERLAPGHRIASYRGGHLPSERRAVEDGLRRGNITGVVSTSALELGIDVGSFDAVVCCGYPGSLSSFQQRIGRAGRRNASSLAVYIPSADPLDQYVAAKPSLLIETPAETAYIDPDHNEVLLPHLACAAFEIPVTGALTFGSAHPGLVEGGLNDLVKAKRLVERVTAAGARALKATGFPAGDLNMRGKMEDNVTIYDVENEKEIGELDFTSAHTMVHSEAIYLHDSRDYIVDFLDIEHRRAYVHPIVARYDTTAMSERLVSVDHIERQGEVEWTNGPLRAAHGDVTLETHFTKYKKITRGKNQNIGYGDIELPPIILKTKGFVIEFPVASIASVVSLEGLAAALRGVACVGLMVAGRDLDAAVRPTGDAFAVVLFEKQEKGNGLASRIFDARANLLDGVHTVLDGCPCKRGCQACVGVHDGITNMKEAVRALLA